MASSNEGGDFRRAEFPRIGMKRDVARIDALSSKLVPPADASYGGINRPIKAPDWTVMQRLANETTTDIRDISNLFQLLPDTELSMQILTSSILSPKDMLSTELHYRIDGERFTSELTGAMLGVLRDHFDNEHKITDSLTEMLEDALFKTGSYPIAILPESTLDEAINSHSRVTMESIRGEFEAGSTTLHSIGLLGNSSPRTSKTTTSLESLLSGSTVNYNTKQVDAFYLSIVDNFDVLKLPRLRDKIRQDAVQSRLNARGVAMESFQGNTNTSIYRQRQFKYMPVLTMRPASQTGKANFGHPLVMHLPSESVIPVHVPGSPSDHLCYFIVLDENGNPLSQATEVDYYQQMGSNLQASTGADQAFSNDIKRMHSAWFGAGENKSDETREIERLYADVLERELVSRLQAGVYGDEVEITRDPEVYRIMMARAARGMRTQLLCIPRELMIYVAFDYNAYGIGQSLLSKSKIIAGIRAMLMLADTKAALKNAVGRSKVSIGLDEKDPDPGKTVEFALHEYAKVNAGAMPLGIGNPQDILNYLQRASVDVEVSGNTRYPATTFDVDDVQSNKTRPDQELQTEMRKRHIQSFGLSPETVDGSQGPDFATTVVSNNLLMSKRIAQYQRKFGSFLTDYVRTYTLNSQTLMDELRTILKENIDKLTEEQRETQTDGQVQSATNTVNVKQSVNADKETQSSAGGQPSGMSEEELNIRKKYLKTRYVDLKKQIDEAGWDAVIMDFITSLFVELPAPDGLALETQLKAYDAYKQGVESAISAYLDAEFVTEGALGQELASYVDTIKKTLIAYYLRRYMRENNILPELDELTTFNEEDGPAINLLAIQEDHVSAIAKSVLSYATALSDRKKQIEAAAQTAGVTADNADNGDSSFGSDATSGSASDGGGFDTLTDDVNGSETTVDDAGEDTGEETTTEETSEETTTTTDDGETTSSSSTSSASTSTDTDAS